ncbi:biotin--[acetyl-CoA-carboxylase] ligase [Sphingobacterium faecium]|uniref:biotin--[acetyl-CoA-carboxylase] ligase n=1 Tax=Sphingobacterium faecium TaxID=34087 RepID=UPI0024697CF8|nr:biotin--[acetyl-CoA-carboxylase] ligase [Sphingobacterium faecium]MDH5828616.1 biotin--[acetyl-CoA-carboxylase] ligase [Sphingobacterium faecium]
MQNNTFSGLIIGQSLITLDRVASTNDYFKDNLSKFKPQDEGSAILAVEQFAGKGQRGNIWTSEPGKNITTSILLYPHFLAIDQQFSLSCAISLGIFNWIKTKTDQKAHIKWPNDIYVNDEKIAGILIENSIKGYQIATSIIGIGINVNQINFENSNHITSLRSITGVNEPYVIADLAHELYVFLDVEYKRLQNGDHEKQLIAYNQHLFRKDEWRKYKIHEEERIGKIIEVHANGLLQIEIENELKEFSLQEIRYIL